MLARITAVYRLHGFDPLETAAVETVEALGKFLPDVDRVLLAVDQSLNFGRPLSRV